MSLILDALEKLERDKQRPDPGVVVVGSIPWEGLRPARRARALLAVAVVVTAAIATWWWLAASAARPTSGQGSAVVWRQGATTPPPPTAVASAPSPATASSLGGVDSGSLPADVHLGAAPRSRPFSVPAVTGPVPPPSLHSTAATELTGASGQSPPPPDARASAVPPGTARDELQLTAITQRDGRPLALINQRLVREGDSFDGVRILRIGEAEVEVEVQGRRRVLRF